jgi:cell division protein FtsB
MLLNEFLKAHRGLEEQTQKNEKQEATITALQEEVRRLSAAVKDRARRGGR